MSEPAKTVFDLRGRSVWVAGHRGMVGSALVRRLASSGCSLLTVSRYDLDLRRQSDVEAWMAAHRPQVVFLAAGLVGGIEANRARPVGYCNDNLLIAANVVGTAARIGVEKLMLLGSACIYPRLCEQPMSEAKLMTGRLEPSNEGYAIAKLAGIILCQAFRKQHGCDFICPVATNLYGEADSLDCVTGHVVPALIQKVMRAKASGQEVEIWGTGNSLREFVHVNDAADAMVFLMERYSSMEIINIGGGQVVTMRELAQLIAQILSFRGKLSYDTSRPDGMPRKQLDSARILAMGWRPAVTLREGLEATCRWVAKASWSDVAASGDDPLAAAG